MNKLPIVKIKGAGQFFVDARLRELRNVKTMARLQFDQLALVSGKTYSNFWPTIEAEIAKGIGGK